MPPKNGIAAGILFLQKGGFQGKTCKNLPKGKASEDCWWLLFLGSEKKKKTMLQEVFVAYSVLTAT